MRCLLISFLLGIHSIFLDGVPVLYVYMTVSSNFCACWSGLSNCTVFRSYCFSNIHIQSGRVLRVRRTICEDRLVSVASLKFSSSCSRVNPGTWTIELRKTRNMKRHENWLLVLGYAVRNEINKVITLRSNAATSYMQRAHAKGNKSSD